MTFIKTSVLSGISVVVKLLTLLGVNKVLAIYLGPSGYAMIGQFQNLIQIVSVVASGAFGTGVTKYTAHYDEELDIQHLFWQSAFAVSGIVSIILSVLIYFLSDQLAVLLFDSNEHSAALSIFSISIFFFSSNILLLAILNGKKETVSYVFANILGSVVSALLSVMLVINYGILGGLIALGVYQSLGFFVTLFICLRKEWFKPAYVFGAPDVEALKKLSAFSVMALTSAICLPLTHMFIRDYISENIGLEYAGLWEAMSRISTLYLMVITTTLTLYYLPKLSELKDRNETISEVLSIVKIVFPIIVVLSGVVYILRDIGITLLFSDSFLEISEIYIWQISGDVLKVVSWLFAFVMISKAMTFEYVISEMIFSIIHYILVVEFVSVYGFEGSSIAYMTTYFLYLLFAMYVVFFRYAESGKKTS